MTGSQALADRGVKRPGKKWVTGRPFSVAAQIDDLDLGHGGAGGARGQRKQADSALVGSMVRLDRGRGAPEDAHRTGVLRPEQGHVAGVIAKALVLLERRVVLFVDDDQPEIGDRRKQRGARADRHLHPPPAERLPGVLALSRGETAMKHCDVVSEARAETSDELWRERDLRHEQDRPTAQLAHFVDGAEVHLGLSGTGDAVQKERLARAVRGLLH